MTLKTTVGHQLMTDIPSMLNNSFIVLTGLYMAIASKTN